MAVAASIRFVQGATDGGPGRALIGVAGTAVHASNAADTPDVKQWTWEWIDVAHGSAIPLGVAQDGSTPSFTFTPDVADSYLLHLTVKDASGAVAEDFRCFAVQRSSGRLVPPFRGTDASMNFAGAKVGWSAAMFAWLDFLDGLSGGGGTPGGSSGQAQFNSSGAFAGTASIVLSGVSFRDLAVHSPHLLSMQGDLTTSIDSGGDLLIGSTTGDVKIGLAAGGGIPLIRGGADGFPVLQVQNTDTSTGAPGGVEIRAGLNGSASGGKFLECKRPDNTSLMQVVQSAADAVDIIPSADNKGSVGTNSNRWALVRAAVVTQGDSVFECPERGAHWVVQEERERMTIYNRVTGRRYAFVLEEIEGGELPPPL